MVAGACHSATHEKQRSSKNDVSRLFTEEGRCPQHKRFPQFTSSTMPDTNDSS